MKIETSGNGITLIREPGDKRIAHESTVTHHMRRLLNERDGTTNYSSDGWRRFYPDKYGLTSCKQGVHNAKTHEAYWHERYAIENAAQEFNKTGKVWYMKVDGGLGDPLML